MSKKCFYCHQILKKKIKNISGVDIYECKKCQIAVLNKNIKSKIDLYSFIDYQRQEKKLRERFLKLAKIISTFINQGKILDVGAGFGLLASILSKLGNFQLEVVEPYIEPYYLKNENIKFINHKSTYQNFLTKKDNKKFDLILMFDILEHFSNPHIVLKKTRNILKNEGFLVIQTPNYKSLMAKICQSWSWWMVEDHKVIFSPNSLKRILKKTGYKIVYFRSYEDWIDFKKNLDGNFSSIKIAFLRKFIKIFFFLIFSPFYFLIRSLLWRLGYGGAIFLIAKRYNIKNES